MSKRKKVTHSRKEEKQAQRVMKIVLVSLMILGLIIIVGFSFFN